MRDSDIYWRKQKIGYILGEHPEISIDTVKAVPEILEQPVIVMKSLTRDDSVIMFGDLKAENGENVMASLELTPKAGGDMEADFLLLTSAYGRSDGSIQNLLSKSEILYIAEDKDRADTWLMQLRVQFPSRQPAYGSIGNISYADGGVKIHGKTLSDMGGKLGADGQTAKEKFSISETLDDELDAVLEGAFNAARGEIRIGETSNFMTDVIGAEPMTVLMPAGKAYSAMVTEARAKEDGRFDPNTNYHGLGRNGLLTVLEKSEEPVAAFAAPADEDGNKRQSRIVLVTDEDIDGGKAVVIEEVSTRGIFSGHRIDANKVITAYSRGQIRNDMAKAMSDGRMLYLDKKRSRNIYGGMKGSNSPTVADNGFNEGQSVYSGVKGSNSPTAISNGGFTNNIRSFWANVNWKNEGRGVYEAEADTQKTPFALAMEEAEKKAGTKDDGRYSISDDNEKQLTAEQQKYYDDLQEAKELKNAGADGSYIFARTGWVAMYGEWSYGFDNVLPNGESADIILEKDGILNGSEQRRLGVGAEAYREVPENDARGTGQGDRPYNSEMRRGAGKKSWAATTDGERKRLSGIVSRYAANGGAEAIALLEEFGAPEAFAKQISDDYAQGRVVAERWATFIPELDSMLDEFDEALSGGSEKYSISDAEQKQEVLSQLRQYLNGDINKIDLQRYVDTIDTSEDSPAQQIVDAAHAQNMSVEEYVRYNWDEYERDGELNEDARAALQLERQLSRKRYSIDENGGIMLPTAEDLDTDVISTLPKKAQTYLQRAERALVSRISNALSVPKFAQRTDLKNAVSTMASEYLNTGTVSQETLNGIFERAYEQGKITDDEYYNQYKDIKDRLIGQAVTISEQDKADIADYGDFKKSAAGTLRIVNEGGLPVDTAYQELTDMAPELFPADITHPADQLMRMYEVGRSIEKSEKNLNEYYGREASEFKKWAKNDFEVAAGEIMSELRNVRRFADERAQVKEDAKISTLDEVKQAYAELKEARRTYTKAEAKNLLTEQDKAQVVRLLKGEISLENLDASRDNIPGITAVYEAKQEYERLSHIIREWNTQRKAQLKAKADSYLETANDWKDKAAGLLYSRETMERNTLDIVPDNKLAQSINREYFKSVHVAQAAATKMKNDYRARVRDLKLSRKVIKGNTVSEAHAVQLLGEAEDNIKMLENSRGRIQIRDGKTLADWKGVVQALWGENPKLNEQRIRAAVDEFRKIYDELFEQMNEVRVRNGYEPVNYRKGYFPHFQPGTGDGILSLFGKALGISTDVTALPTTINGMTHTFKPGIQWFGNAQERIGFSTAYDAVEGFDKYIEGVADVIHQTDNIQKLRALASQIRYRTGDEGIRKQIDAVYADTSLSDQDKQNRIDKIFESGKYTLSNYVVELEEYTNLLANKKSRADRNMEQAFGRRAYNVVKALESRVAANMVAVNPGSWLTNFIPLTQGGAMLDRGMLLRGMWNTLKSYKAADDIVDRSSFLTNRQGSDPLVKTWAQAASAKMSSPMEYIDQFTAGSLVRARYAQNLKQGLSETEAISEADDWVAGVMADRSKGSMPTLFNRSNPLTKVFTQFQLEVNNQLSYLFKDMPRGMREKGLAAVAGALLKFFLGAWLYNEVYEHFIGRRPALDPIGILNDTVGDITGWELPNLVELGVGAVSGDMPSFKTEKKNAYDTVSGLAGTVAEELPFIGGVLGGGRVPISSALPDWDNLLKAATSDTWSSEKKLATLAKELGNPLTYLALPFGGGQMKKIYQGMKAVIQGGSYSVDSDGNDIMQYPVFSDSAWETAANTTRAILFGKTSLPTAQDWIDNDFKSYGAKETAAYQGMVDAGVPQEDAYALLNELRNVQPTKEQSAAELKRKALEASDISGAGKSVVYYGMLATEKEQLLMDELADMDADMGKATDALMQIKDAGDLKGAEASNAKRDAIADSGLSEIGMITMYRYMFGTAQDDGTYTTSRDDDIEAFDKAGLDFKDFLTVQNSYATIGEQYDSTEDKALNFSRWVNKQKYSEEQAALVKDSFTYYSQIPASAAKYESFVSAGISDDEAYDLTNQMNALEPEAGEDKVSDLQKYKVVIDSGLSSDKQLSALGTLMSESEYAKLQTGYNYGVTPQAYVGLKEIMPQYDLDGSGGYSQAEVEEAIEALSGNISPEEALMLAMMGDNTQVGISLTNDQKAVLWQIWTNGKNGKNNPYSTSIGKRIYDIMNAQ